MTSWWLTAVRANTHSHTTACRRSPVKCLPRFTGWELAPPCVNTLHDRGKWHDSLWLVNFAHMFPTFISIVQTTFFWLHQDKLTAQMADFHLVSWYANLWLCFAIVKIYWSIFSLFTSSAVPAVCQVRYRPIRALRVFVAEKRKNGCECQGRVSTTAI